MASNDSLTTRRNTAIESIHTIAASLAERYDVPNPVLDLDYDMTRLESIDKAKSLLFQTKIAEQQAAMLALFESILTKITPPAD